MMDTVLEMSLPPLPAYVGVARLAVSLTAYRLHYPVDAVADIDVAVGEACGDAIGYGRMVFTTDAEVRLRCVVGSGLFVITVDVIGRPCDPPPLLPHQGPFPAEHALGKFVLDALMDTVAYRCTEAHGLSIRLVKALPEGSRLPAGSETTEGVVTR